MSLAIVREIFVLAWSPEVHGNTMAIEIPDLHAFKLVITGVWRYYRFGKSRISTGRHLLVMDHALVPPHLSRHDHVSTCRC